MEYTTILNIGIQNLSQSYLLEHLKRGVLFTPNVDHIVKLQKDKEFYDCYQKADWVICDSRILFFVSHFLHNPLQASISGADLFPAFYTYHKDDPDCRIFILGAKEGVAENAMNRINNKIGRTIVVGAHSPSFGFENNEQECFELVKIVNRSGANVLLVGVGAPKQEKWIIKYKEQMPGVDLFMALGATIDFEAGALRRAPLFWRRCGLEWLFRFIKEPRRLFKRYFVDDMRFFYYFAKQIMGIYKNPFAKQYDR